VLWPSLTLCRGRTKWHGSYDGPNPHPNPVPNPLSLRVGVEQKRLGSYDGRGTLASCSKRRRARYREVLNPFPWIPSVGAQIDRGLLPDAFPPLALTIILPANVSGVLWKASGKARGDARAFQRIARAHRHVYHASRSTLAERRKKAHPLLLFCLLFLCPSIPQKQVWDEDKELFTVAGHEDDADFQNAMWEKILSSLCDPG